VVALDFKDGDSGRGVPDDPAQEGHRQWATLGELYERSTNAIDTVFWLPTSPERWPTQKLSVVPLCVETKNASWKI